MCKFNSAVVESEKYQKGDVVYCNLNSTLFDSNGDEIYNPTPLIKKRPVLVLKPLKFTCIVLPIKTKHSIVFDDEYYHEIEYEQDHPSLICLSNIMTVDNRQLQDQRVCKFKDEIVDEILKELGLMLEIPGEGIVEKKISTDPAKDALFDYIVNAYGSISAFKKSEMEKDAPQSSNIDIEEGEKEALDSAQKRGKYRKTKKFVDLTPDEIGEISNFAKSHTVKETTNKFNISSGTFAKIKKGVDPKISIRFNDEFIKYANNYIIAGSNNDYVENVKIIETYKNYCKNKGIEVPGSYDSDKLTLSMIKALRTRSPRYLLSGRLSYGIKFRFK